MSNPSPPPVRVRAAWPKSILLLSLVACFVLGRFSGKLNPYHADILTKIGINIILAVSLNLVNGYTGQFSLGHAGFMAVGAYTSAAITLFVGPKILPAEGAAGFAAAGVALFIAALLAGGLLAAISGLIVGAPSLRLKGDYLAIVTLGFGEIIRVVFQNLDRVGGARGLSVMHGYTDLFWTFGLVAVTVYIVTSLINSTYGRGFIAVRDDEVAAEAMGINTTKYKVTAFVVGAFFAGIAGGLYAHSKQFITPNGFNFMESIAIVVMVVLGGMGNTPGVILAAILLTILPEVLRPVAEYRMVIYSLLLIVLMLTRPQGLFVWRRKIPEATP